MTSDHHSSHDRGAVLLLALIMLTLLSLMVSSALRASAYSVSAAGWLRLAQSAELAGAAALDNALAQTSFRTDRTVVLPVPQPTGSIRVSLSVIPLGFSPTIPHRDYDMQLHHAMAAHYFTLRATVTTSSGYGRQHEALIAIVTDAPPQSTSTLFVDLDANQDIQPGAMLLLGRRIKKVDHETL